MVWCGSRASPSPAWTRPWPGCAGPGCACSSPPTTRRPTRAELHRRLAHCGITADDADVLSSADVAAGMLAPGTTALVLADDGVVEALAGRGVTVVPEGPADAVVVGWTAVLHLRSGGPRRGRGAGGGAPDRHERGPHPPDPGRVAAGCRRAARRRGHRRRDRRPRWPASPISRRATPSRGWWRRGSCAPWWATARPPTGSWPPSSRSRSPWSSQG